MRTKEGKAKKAGGAGAAAADKEEKQQSKRFQTLLKVVNPSELPDELLSDEDEDENRVGNIPLWWYDALDHIGYNRDGEPLQKKEEFPTIEKLLSTAQHEEGWRTVYDAKNRRTVRLTDTDLEIIRRVQNGSFPLSSFKEEDFHIDSDLEDSIFPMHNKPEPKRRFLPSQHEQQKITRLISLIRSGQLQKQQQREAAAREQQTAVFDLWKSDIYISHSAAAAVRGLPALPAPKMRLPGHAESYNPPEEFLFTPQEEKEWKEMDSADRPLSFLPRRFAALRHVGAFQNLLLERFNRCLDLYLCPRSMKLRMNVDPASLLPALPPLQELKPFPTSIRIDYLPAAAYSQLQLLPRPLYTLSSSSSFSSLSSLALRVSLLNHVSVHSTRRDVEEGQEEEKKKKEEKKKGEALDEKEKTEEEEDLLFLQRLLLSEGVLCLSIDPSGSWLAVGEKTSAAAAAETDKEKETRTFSSSSFSSASAALGRLWVFEVSSGKAFLSFELQQQVTAVAFHPCLPLLAAAVEEQLLLLVLDLPLFDASKLLQLTSLSAAEATEKTSVSKKKKKRNLFLPHVQRSLHRHGELSRAVQEEEEKEEEEREEEEEEGKEEKEKEDRRRALIEEAMALLRPVEFAEASGGGRGGGGEETTREEEEEEQQQHVERGAAAAAAGEGETPGRRERRERKGVGMPWQQIRVKGMAAAPAAAGALANEKKARAYLLLQQQQQQEGCGAGENKKKKEEKEKESGLELESNPIEAADDAKEEKNDTRTSPPLVSAPLGGLLCGVSIPHDSTITCLSWHHKGGYLVAVCPGSVSPSQQCSIHSLKKKKTIHPLRKAPGGRMRAAAFHPTKPWLVLAYQKAIRIFNLQRAAGPNDDNDDPSSRKLSGAEGTCCLDVHRRGMQIVAGGDNRNVYIFDLDLSSRVYKTFQNHTRAVCAVALHPVYPLLFTASHDGTVQIYHFKVFDDLFTNPLIIPVRKLRVAGEGTARVTACAWHPTQPWLVTGDSAGGCSLWG